MEIYDSAQEKGLVVPILSISPKHRLNTQWVELLEATADVSMELNRVEFTVSKVKSAPHRKEGIYFFDTWVQDIYIHILEMNGESYRLRQSKKTNKDQAVDQA
jgi:hypothetical protein